MRRTLQQSPGNWRGAAYHSGSGSTALVFRYVVKATETDADGVAIGTNTLAQGGDPTMGVQGGGTIRSAGGVNAYLANAGKENLSAHKVNGSLQPPSTAPTVSGVSVLGVVAVETRPISKDGVMAAEPSPRAKRRAPSTPVRTSPHRRPPPRDCRPSNLPPPSTRCA